MTGKDRTAPGDDGNSSGDDGSSSGDDGNARGDGGYSSGNDGNSPGDDGSSGPREHAEGRWLDTDRIADAADRFIHIVELVAAWVFAVLFAVGVVDLTLQIIDAVRRGTITDPLVVIGFIDTGLLLLIIIEVYQTVIAYTRESETRRIVRLVIYTGVIAMVRKAIIFRVGEHPSTLDALFAAIAYAVIILGLAVLLYIERSQR